MGDGLRISSYGGYARVFTACDAKPRSVEIQTEFFGKILETLIFTLTHGTMPRFPCQVS